MIEDEGVGAQATALQPTDDERRLHELGYAQELRRHMSGFSNFAVSFTIISILSGCLTLYGTGMTDGGPVIITWGWPFVGVMTLFVGLAMAEVCSSFPTAGGLYYWSAKLAPRNPAAWSWFTGWFNFLGQVAVTAGIDFGAAFFLNALLDLEWNFSTAQHWHTIVLFAAILVLHGVLNQFGVAAGRAAEQRERVVAHPRRAGHRRGAGVRAVPPPERVVRVHPLRERQRLGLEGLRADARPAAGPVHVHRLRRVGPHDRGDPRRRGGGPARDRHLDHRVAAGGLGAADRGHVRDPELLGRGRRHRPAGADLHRRDRRDRREAAAADRDRRAAVLRDVVGDGELADDLRVLPRRRGPGQRGLASHQPEDPDPDQRDLAGGGRARSSSACRTCGTAPPTRR